MDDAQYTLALAACYRKPDLVVDIRRRRAESEQATQTILSLLPKLWTSGRIEVENACADLAYKERHG
jgi:hypothetical protein